MALNFWSSYWNFRPWAPCSVYEMLGIPLRALCTRQALHQLGCTTAPVYLKDRVLACKRSIQLGSSPTPGRRGPCPLHFNSVEQLAENCWIESYIGCVRLGSGLSLRPSLWAPPSRWVELGVGRIFRLPTLVLYRTVPPSLYLFLPSFCVYIVCVMCAAL